MPAYPYPYILRVDGQAQRPPMPNIMEQRRAEHQGARYYMLLERTRDMLKVWLKKYYDADQLQARGQPNASVNALVDICNGMSRPGQYGLKPRIYAPDEDGAELINQMEMSGVWTTGMRTQYFAWGLGSFTRCVEWSPRRERLVFRQVPPSNIYVMTDDTDTKYAIFLAELRERYLKDETGKLCRAYAWDIYDIRDPENPTFKIVCATGKDGDDTFAGRDVTVEVLGEAAAFWMDYPWKTVSGRAVIPYNTQRTDDSDYFNADTRRSAFHGSLDLMTLWTDFFNAFRFASATFAVAVGIDFGSVGQRDPQYPAGPTHSLQMTPGSLVVAQPSSEDDQRTPNPNIFKIDPGQNIDSLLRGIYAFQVTLLSRFGINAEDASRKSQNPTSGVALHISNQQKRIAMESMEPLARAADMELIELCSIVSRIHGGVVAPETGYSIEYQRLPKSPDEERTDQQIVDGEVAAGRMSQIDAYMARNPGTNRDAAIAALRQIAADNALVREINPIPTPEDDPESLPGDDTQGVDDE